MVKPLLRVVFQLSSIMVENLREEPLVAHRLVYDLINSLGGIKKFNSISINNKMRKSVNMLTGNIKQC